MNLFRAAGADEENDAGQSDLDIERTRVCPHELVYSAFADVSLRARRKSVSLEFRAASALPETIFSDGPRLRQILANLVSNAIRFTLCGCVKVVARMVSIHGRALLSIDVIDSGAGIPIEAYQAIFDPREADIRPGTQRIGGTEFGLRISRRIARSLGGDLIVRSAPGEGCTFTVRVDAGPLDGVEFIQPSEIRAQPRTDALRLLDMCEELEARLHSGDRAGLPDLACSLRDASLRMGSEAYRGPANALAQLGIDAKEQEIVALIDELRSLAEDVANGGSPPGN